MNKQPIIIQPTSREHWLALRTEDITSTEISALYGQSPYITEFELYHHKLAKTYTELEDNDRMRWGRRLQDAIAAGIAEDMGWQITPCTVYMRHATQRGMGCSFDYNVIFEDGVRGKLEIKAVDYLQHREKWIDEPGAEEAPIPIEWQLQDQLEIANEERGAIGALVSGNKTIVLVRDRDHELGAKFCERIEQFWQDLENGIEPTPDFERDTEMLKKLYSEVDGSTVVLTGNNRAMDLCEEYAVASEIAKQGDARKQTAKNELLTLIGNAEKAIIGDFSVSAGLVNRKGYMVEPTTYRNMRVTRKK